MHTATEQPTAPAKTMPLYNALRQLASDPGDAVLDAGTQASIRTLNSGVRQWTRQITDPEMIRKHQARLIAALQAMADALEQEEVSADAVQGEAA